LSCIDYRNRHAGVTKSSSRTAEKEEEEHTTLFCKQQQQQQQVWGKMSFLLPGKTDRKMIRCCAVLCCAVLFCAVLCYAMLCCAVVSFIVAYMCFQANPMPVVEYLVPCCSISEGTMCNNACTSEKAVRNFW